MFKKATVNCIILLLVLLSVFMLSACVNTPPQEKELIIDYKNVVKEVPFGTELNLGGLVVKVKMTNGTYVMLKRGKGGYSVDDGGYNQDVPGDYTITISYKDYERVSFVITVKEEEIIDEDEDKDITVVAIEVKKTVGKRLFYVGEPFDNKGIVVECIYSNGKRETVGAPQLEFDSDSFNSHEPGEYTITVRYYPKYSLFDTYTVTVIEAPSPVLTEIEIITDQATLEFRYGESFTSDGIIVEKYYDDDGVIIKEIASPEELIIDHSQYNAQSLGKYSIIITVSGTNVNQSYEVEVVDYVVGIDLQIASPHYELGEQFSSEDITIYLIMASGAGAQGALEDFTVDDSDFNPNEVGEYTIKVSMNGNPQINAEITVYVNEPLG